MFWRLIIGTTAMLIAVSGAGQAAGAATREIDRLIEGRAAYVSPVGTHMLKGNDFGPDFNVSPVRPTAPKASPA